ncbi:MAG: hypothetical protein JSW11_20230 [Candidatus Heimdallarchaeota archaeon]|nr:MAG: hypothetical protein JSW11_20230 [Candidatus Heimdallarchaeota archaeon]
MEVFFLRKILRAPLHYRQIVLFGSLLLVFFTSGCVYRSWEEIHHYLAITKVDSSGFSPIGNLTHNKVSSIPVLHSALNKSLSFTIDESKEFDLSEDEMDQISRLFSLLKLPHKEECGTSNPWYIFFEASLFEIDLYSVIIYYN